MIIREINMTNKIRYKIFVLILISVSLLMLLAFLAEKQTVVGDDSYQLLNEQQLFEIALREARNHGLEETILEQKTAILTQGEWLYMNGVIQSTDDPNLPLYILALRGNGIWKGPGFISEDQDELEITGVTIALNATDGMLVLAVSGFVDPDLSTGQQFTRPDVLPTHPPILNATPNPEITREALSGEMLPLPPRSN
jgi:hypothetical protein